MGGERKGWTPNSERPGGREFRKKHIAISPRYGLAITDCVFMSSTDGYRWNRFDEACLTPGYESDCNRTYGNCYPAVGLIRTEGRYFGYPEELSLLCEAYHRDDKPTELIRFVYRKDGFASVKRPINRK